MRGAEWDQGGEASAIVAGEQLVREYPPRNRILMSEPEESVPSSSGIERRLGRIRLDLLVPQKTQSRDTAYELSGSRYCYSNSAGERYCKADCNRF